MSKASTHPVISRAISHFGSQALMAKAIGSSQSAISRMLLLEIVVTAEAAVAIDRASCGKINRWELRPDLWDAPTRTAPKFEVEVRT